jgi:hypothetical protein
MNAFQRALLEDPSSNIIEVCDCCNEIIWGWETPRARLSFDGRWLCKKCDKEDSSNPAPRQ